MSSASYRPREAIGVVVVHIPRLENGGSQECKSKLSLKAQELGALTSKGSGRWMSQLKQRTNLPFQCLFILFRPSADWVRPTSIREGYLLYLVS